MSFVEPREHDVVIIQMDRSCHHGGFQLLSAERRRITCNGCREAVCGGNVIGCDECDLHLCRQCFEAERMIGAIREGTHEVTFFVDDYVVL